MSSNCEQPLSSCPARNVTRDLSGNGHNTVNHDKNRSFTMTVGDVVIPLQKRERHFMITYTESWSWSDLTIVIDNTGNAEDCGTKTGTGAANISEDATFTDTEFVYLDHMNKIAMWREWVEKCKFTQAAAKSAVLRTPYGSFYAHWFEITPVIMQTEKWYVLVNGVKEEVDSWDGQVTLPLVNILWPLPPSLAMPSDPCPTSFYDYNSDDELAQLDGGKDFYYPSWIRGMGLNRGIDEDEAADRYASYFFHDSRPALQQYDLPGIGYANPIGNAVKDSDGNILLSLQTRHNNINRIYLNDKDKTIINLNNMDILEGDKLKLYPVGII